MAKYEKFEALSEEKRTDIMNAAMEEFVKGGYEKASVNSIVRQAGISKGSLFFYFSNKKCMYLYFFEYVESLVVNHVKRQHYKDEPDFITRMKNSMQRNLELLSELPLAYAFMKSCKAETSEAVRVEVEAIRQKSAEKLFSGLYKEIDRSLFRDDLDINQAMYTMKVTMFQIVHEHMQSTKFDTTYIGELLSRYAEFFRTAFYG